MVPHMKPTDDSSVSNPLTKKPRRSEEMKKLLSFQPTPSPKKAPILTLLNKIPLLASLLTRADDVGRSVSGLAQLHGQVANTAGAGFQIANLALVAVDFISIPAIYLAAAIVGEKPPITLSKNATWIYSGVLLGLTIAALAVPGAAPIIVLSIASLGLGVSLLTMGRALYNRYQFSKELKNVEQQIATETQDLNDLHSKTLDLEKKLLTAEQEGKTPEQLSALQKELDDTTADFHNLFKNKRAPLQALYDKKFNFEKKIEQNKTTAIMDKGVGVVLSAIAVAGLALSLFFPPLGGALIAGAAVAGIAYLVGRLTFPIIKGWMTKLFTKKETVAPVDSLPKHAELEPNNKLQNELSHSLDLSLKTEATHVDAPSPPIKNPLDTIDEQLNISPNITPSMAEHAPIEQPVHESTTTTMQLLFGEKGADLALHQQISDSQSIEKIQHRLSALVEHHDMIGALTFLSDLSSYIQTADSKITTDDLRQFYCNIEESNQIISLVKQALSQIKTGYLILDEEDKNKFMGCQPLVNFLNEHDVDLHVLTLKKVVETNNEIPTLKIDPEEP